MLVSHLQPAKNYKSYPWKSLSVSIRTEPGQSPLYVSVRFTTHYKIQIFIHKRKNIFIIKSLILNFSLIRETLMLWLSIWFDTFVNNTERPGKGPPSPL